MIRGFNKEPVPFVLEDDRSNDPKEQTIFWVVPKKAHEANMTVKRYGGASRDVRGGYREFNVKKLDAADSEEFISTVVKIENYGFSEDSSYFLNYKETNGVVKSSESQEIIAAVAMDLPSGYLTEIFDAATDAHKLEAGRHVAHRGKKK